MRTSPVDHISGGGVFDADPPGGRPAPPPCEQNDRQV